VAINVSSPNTPNLRDLQNAENLDDLLFALQSRNDELGSKPLLLKIAPDLNDSQLAEIVELCGTHRVAGVIATNTTTSRENLRTKNVERFGNGGVSGRPVRSLANRVISKVYSLSDGKLPVIGVGGIFTAEDAFEKVERGACLIQAYTGFVYRGPAFAREVNEGLLKLLEKRGFESLDAAVGSRTEAA
jgi:dihydroorotate dehydrogenase